MPSASIVHPSSPHCRLPIVAQSQHGWSSIQVESLGTAEAGPMPNPSANDAPSATLPMSSASVPFNVMYPQCTVARSMSSANRAGWGALGTGVGRVHRHSTHRGSTRWGAHTGVGHTGHAPHRGQGCTGVRGAHSHRHRVHGRGALGCVVGVGSGCRQGRSGGGRGEPPHPRAG